MTCSCPEPNEGADPRHKGQCLKCALPIDPRVLSSDETVGEFYDWLERAEFPKGGVTPVYGHFRQVAEAREREGREKFGLSYLHRKNEAEALEELADASNYLLFAVLQARQRGEDEEWSTAVEVARHCFKAYEFAALHAAKRRGSP